MCHELVASISASHDTYTGTVTILPELTCHTGLLAATRGDLWEDGPERWRLNPHTPMTCQARTKILYCIAHRVVIRV